VASGEPYALSLEPAHSRAIRQLPWIAAAFLTLWVLHSHVSPQFTPLRAELAGVAGFSRGILNLVVLPAGTPFRHAPAWSLAACGAVFLLLAGVRRRAWTRTRKLEVMATGLHAVAIALFAAVGLSPYVSSYHVVLAPRTFMLGLALLCFPRLAAAASFAGDHRAPAGTVGRRLLVAASGVLGALFFASAMLQTLASYGGNYSGFLHLSTQVADRAPFLLERPGIRRTLVTSDAGYDGQFMYLMAFDPFLRRFGDRPEQYRAVVDNPPYRYGRIGFSLATFLAAGGEPARYPAVMVWLIVAAHLALAMLLAAAAARGGQSPLAGLWFLAIPGFMSSLMSALPEALAAAALVAGILAWQDRRLALAAAAFGVALLVRETGVLLVLALVLSSGREHVKRSLGVLAASVLPVCAWRVYVASRLFGDFGWSAVVATPGDFGAPFAGLAELLAAGWSGIQPSPEVAGALLFPGIVVAALVLAVSLLAVRRGPLEIAAVGYGLIAVSLNYEKIWSHLPSGERGTFELFLCLLLLLLEGRTQPAWVRPALYAFFVVLLAYTFFVAPDAGTSRAALLLIR
jgi:hypothetical protein